MFLSHEIFQTMSLGILSQKFCLHKNVINMDYDERMDQDDIGRILLKNPALGIRLVMLKPEVQSHVQVIEPDALPEKYRDFCNKLDLKRPPTLVICRLQDFGKIEGMQMGGFYDCLQNAVWLPKEILEGFKNDRPASNYVVAHELGHAKDTMSRRRFLSWAGAAAGGAATGIGTWNVMRYVTDIPEEKRNPNDNSFLSSVHTSLSMVSSGYFSFKASQKVMRVLIKATKPSTRAEEFTADDYAKQIVGLNGIVVPLMYDIIAQQTQQGRQDIEHLVQRIDERLERESIELTPEERTLLIAIQTIQLFDVYRAPLSDIVLKDAYPDFADRLKHQQEAILEIIKPTLEKHELGARL